jgi:RNA polymerase sigma-70 factor (ECF subfamily)
MDDLELSDRCRSGDNNARKQLYERFAGRMLVVCLRYAGNRDLAQDLMHDGFVKVFTSLDKFTWRGEGSLRAWIERVMMNTALQHLRRNDILEVAVELNDAGELQHAEPEPEEVNAIPERVLLQFIAELPEGYRTVFNLYTFEEKSHREIGQMLGIEERSSSSQLFRAKNTLAARIKEWLKNNS